MVLSPLAFLAAILALGGAQARADASAPALPVPGRIELLWGEGGQLPVHKGRPRFDLGGFLTFEGETIPPPQGRTHVVFRLAEATLIATGTISEDLHVHVILDFKSQSTLENETQEARQFSGIVSSARLISAWAEYQVAPAHVLRAGWFYSPFGLANRTQFSVQRLAVTQPLVLTVGAFSELVRGVEANGELAQDWIYHAYLTAPVTEVFTEGLRLVRSFHGEVELAIGASVQHQASNPDNQRVYSWGADTDTSWKSLGIRAELVGDTALLETYYFEPYCHWTEHWTVFSRFERAFFSFANDNTANDRDRVILGINHFIGGNARRRLKLEIEQNLFRIPRGDDNAIKNYFMIAGQAALEF